MACTTIEPAGDTPIGGQGQSARCSKIFFAPPDCADGIKLDGSPPTSETSNWFSEQVTRIEIRSMVASRKYGHDKSFCAQDTTKGIASWNGSIQTKVQCVPTPFSFYAGATVWLSIFPLGVTNASGEAPCISGYAEIDEDPIIMNLENGDPVEHNFTYSSKGWWNLPAGIDGTFDCCGCCGTGGMETRRPNLRGSENLEGSVFAPGALERSLLSTPRTVYQWTPNGEWKVALDESSGRFMPGPMPSEPGTFPGEMKFVNCVSAA